MRLAVFSHKGCWRSSESPTGFATDGGFAFQMAALSCLFDETNLVVPVSACGLTKGEIPLGGRRIHIVPLSPRQGHGIVAKLSFIPWLAVNSLTLVREVSRADAIHVPIPGDVGTMGMLLAWALGKPLFVRHCGNWTKPKTVAEKFWRFFMERYAGGRNVMLATGGSSEPPSARNPSIRWIFSSSLTTDELAHYARVRSYPQNGEVRLVIVARQELAKGAGSVIRSLPLLCHKFTNLSFDVVGEGSALPEFRRMAAELGVEDRVAFHNKLNHEEVMKCLKQATVFVFPTTSSDGFPKAVLEALASGLPVVATRVSVLPQLIGDGCGVLLSNNSPEEIAKGIEKVISQACDYEVMSRKAIETARQYSLEAWRDTIGQHLQEAWGALGKPGTQVEKHVGET
ncbi:MAG TPA: glycosyltransferase [Clostridia bacterium]|nr:glycosyltransferase [Clostridia bacterium]